MRFVNLVFAFLLFAVVASGSSSISAQFLPMTKVTVHNAVSRGAVANDGSPAVFYFLPSITGNSETADTMVLLQGGWSCDGPASCATRYAAEKNLMSTKWLPLTRPSADYYSQDCLLNPAFCKSNMVFIPYVSSDFWVGNQSKTADIPWTFHGSLILRAVFEDLINGFKMDGALYNIIRTSSSRRVVLSGLSAGAIGTLLNTKRIGDLVTAACPRCSYSAVVDSGTFIGSIPDTLENHTKKQCEADPMQCSFAMEAEVGYSVWNAQLDPDCLAHAAVTKQHPSSCMWMEMAMNFTGKSKGYRCFHAAYLFDMAAIVADGIRSLNATDLEFLMKLTVKRRILFSEFGSSWSPSCLGHIVAGKQGSLTADKVPLNMALSWWHNDGSEKTYLDKCFVPECRKGCNKK